MKFPLTMTVRPPADFPRPPDACWPACSRKNSGLHSESHCLHLPRNKTRIADGSCGSTRPGETTLVVIHDAQRNGELVLWPNSPRCVAPCTDLRSSTTYPGLCSRREQFFEAACACFASSPSLFRGLVLDLSSTEIPGLNDPALGLVNVFFRCDVLDPDTNAVLGEDDVLLLHPLRGSVSYLGHRDPDLVPQPCCAGQDDQEDHERNELPDSGHGCFGGVSDRELGLNSECGVIQAARQ